MLIIDKATKEKYADCPRSLTNTRLEIVRLIATYRFLTMLQLGKLMNGVGAGVVSSRPHQLQKDLLWLKKHQFVEAYAYQPERGNSSQFCFVLTRQGARLIEDVYAIKIDFNSHFRRKPDRERIRFRDVEIELESQIAGAGWKLIRPSSYNQFRPLPIYTEQYKALAQALTVMEQAKARPGGVEVDPNGPHTLGVPLKANDYVAVSPHSEVEGGRGVAVLILCPAKATNQYWEGRVKIYGRIAKDLMVLGVFEDETKANLYKAILKKGRLKVTTLHRVKNGLQRFVSLE